MSTNKTKHYIDMTEDMYKDFMSFTHNKKWWSAIKSEKYDNGSLFLEFKSTNDVDHAMELINETLQRLRQFVGADVALPPGSEDKFSMLQQEVENIGEGIFCFLSKDQKRIIIKGKNYEQVQQAKYMVEVNLGLKQSGGARRNRKFASPEDELIAPSKNQNSASQNSTSHTIKDCLSYTTTEGIKIYVYCSGINNLKVDVLVNAANKDLQHGGGIAYHISKAAGYELDKECEDYISYHGPLYAGSCCSTTAGNLPYKYIIHAVGPMWHAYKHDNKERCLDDLRKTILAALEEANSNGCNSIAIPAISSGIFGVPKELCTEEYAFAVKDYSNKYQRKSCIQEIHFIDKDRSMCTLIQRTFDKQFGKGKPYEL